MPQIREALRRPSGPYLYKYLRMTTPEWVRMIIQGSELYFSSPEQFNDPLDARPKIMVSSRDLAERRLISAWVHDHGGDPIPQLAFDLGNIHRMAQHDDLDRLAASIMRTFHREMNLHRIYSLSVRPDNAHLWKHYAADSTGLCLEFSNEGGPFVMAHHVVYGEELLLDFTSDADFDARTLFYKTQTYSAEEEVRIMLFPRGQPHEVPFDPSLLRRVILGERMSAEHRLLVRRWCRDRAPELEVAECALTP